MRISAEARATALLSAFWALARSLIDDGVLDPKALLGHLASARDAAERNGETEVAVAIDSIATPIFDTYIQESGGK